MEKQMAKPKKVTLKGLKARYDSILSAIARSPIREKRVLIWSGQHGQYWGQNRCGYTPYQPGMAPPNHSEAGIYKLQEALEATWHCGPEKRITFEVYSERLDKEEAGLLHGLAMAAAYLIRNRDEPTLGIEILTQHNVDLEQLRLAKTDEYDLAPIRKHWKQEAKRA
jgi:hypothetical protein